MSQSVSLEFSPYLFNNHLGLKRYLQGDRSRENIARLGDSPNLIRIPTVDAPYCSRWRVIWISMTYPFNSCLSIFYASLGFLSRLFWLQNFGNYFSVKAKLSMRSWETLCDQWTFPTPLLSPSTDIHRADSYDVFSHNLFPLAGITDEEFLELTSPHVRINRALKKGMTQFFNTIELQRSRWSLISRLLYPTKISSTEREKTLRVLSKVYFQGPDQFFSLLKKSYSSDELTDPLSKLYAVMKKNDEKLKEIKHLKLFYEQGVSRGSSLWFINLFMKTKGFFKDPIKHLIAVAREFKKGAPGQAALLNGLEKTDQLLHLRGNHFPKNTISIYELDHNHPSAEEKIKTLPKGTYLVHVNGDALAYFKLRNGKSVIFDPEFGLFQIDPQEMLSLILKHHRTPGKKGSTVRFEKYQTENVL